MAKKNKLLLIVLAAAIVILGGLSALLLLNPEEEKEPEIYVPIITTELSNIQKIEIDNPHSQYEILQQSDGTFHVPSMDGIRMSDVDLQTALEYTANLKADKLIAESFKDGDLYNLDKPYASVVIRLKDGSAITLTIYQQLENDNGYYFTVDGIEKIYYVGASNPLRYFISHQGVLADPSISPFKSYKSLDDFEFVQIQNKNGTFTIERLENSGSDGYGNHYQYKVSGSCEGYLVSRFFYDNMPDLRDFTTSSAYLLNPTAAQLKETGLDKPQSVLYMKNGNGEEVKLLIGSGDKSGYYVMREGNPVIFRLVSGAVTWLDYDKDELTSPYIAAPAIDTASKAVLTIGGETYNFAFDDSARTATCNGKEVDYNNFRNMYKLMCSTIRGEAYTGAKPTSFDATMVFTTVGGTTNVGLTLNGRLVAITVNGKCEYTCRKAFLDSLQVGIDNLMNGNEVRFEW